MSSSRRFPPPWTLEEANDACLNIRDKNRQASPMSISRMSPGDERRPI